MDITVEPGAPPPVAEVPAITPDGGTFTDSVSVELSSGTVGAAIHYTLDGSTPVPGSPGTVLYEGSPFTLTGDAMVTAIAMASGYADSPVASATFTVSGPPPAGGGVYQQDPGPAGIVSMETENYDTRYAPGTHSSEAVAPAGASGGGAVEGGAVEAAPNIGVRIPDSSYVTTSPRADYRVNFIHTGTQYAWVRARVGSGSDDSLHVGLGGAAVATSDRMSQFKPYGAWKWSGQTKVGVARINITSPGEHTLNLWMREDGIVVDKLILPADPDYTPGGQDDSGGSAHESRFFAATGCRAAIAAGAIGHLRKSVVNMHVTAGE